MSAVNIEKRNDLLKSSESERCNYCGYISCDCDEVLEQAITEIETQWEIRE